ncbi:hypothetical protein [Oceanithermus sp.]|uniref:hypothetical protein n=1 Tax=Oceanithermus sp. TaxID=2268145 RepID=UPI00257EFFA2|nr:hypothetical protein [Oceanithermus sp.]
MKRRMVKATIEDEAVYAEVEGHVDAELYEIARRDGGPIAMRVTRVFALHVEGMGGYWIDEDGVKGDLGVYLRDRWLSGADQPMVMPEELDDLGIEFVQPPREQPTLLEVPS